MKLYVKRFFSVFLSVCLVMSIVPVSSMAAEVVVSYTGEALDMEQGNVTIGSDTIVHGDAIYSYTGDVQVEITGTTTENHVFIESGVAADIRLSNVTIDLSEKSEEGVAAIEIADDSTADVTITLEGDNLLKGSPYAAALQKNGVGDGIGTLMIQGTGSLEVVGGNMAAGIGADDEHGTSNICIADGVITAESSDYADGIGVCTETGYTFTNLIIDGGSVKAGFRLNNVKNSEGEGVMPFTIATDGISDITINEKAYPKKHGTSNEIYTYLSIEDVQHVVIGGEEKVYLFNGTDFVAYAESPESVTAFYGDILGDLKLSTVSGGEWKWKDNSLSVGEVGKRSFTAQFVPDASNLYYADSVEVEVTVMPKPITIAGAYVVPKEYDGTVDATVTSVVFDGNLESFTFGEDYTATAEFVDANAGENKDVTVTVEMLNKNYSLESTTFTAKATIDPMVYYDIVASDVELTYGDTNGVVSASSASEGVFSYAVSKGDDVISVDEKTGEITILKAGEAEVEITVVASGNYASNSKKISVTVNKKKITVPQLNSNNSFVYTGSSQTYQLEKSADYTITNATQTEVGSYEAVVTLVDPENTEWESELPIYIYEIQRAQVTITANDTYAKREENPPEYTYTVEGLVNGEELGFEPEISCSTDMTEGEFTIQITGPSQSAHYIFTYVEGTLTVGEKNRQTITVSDIELTYGDTNAQISAVTNGDGILSYVISDGEEVVSVDESTGAIMILGVGTATIKVLATATEDYYSADKNVTVVVHKAEKAPNMPVDQMSVQCGVKTVGELSLPDGWAWPEAAKDDILVAGKEITDVAEYVGDDAGNYEKESVQIVIYREAHTEGKVLFDADDDVSPTCEEGGTGHIECVVCYETVKTKVSVDAAGHDYEVSFVWAADGKSCMAKLICQNDVSHVQEKACEVTAKIKTQATCKTEGVTTYTAIYEGQTAVKDVTDVPKLNTHTWNGGVITKNPSTVEKGEKTFTCEVCGATKVEEIAEIEEEETSSLPKKGEKIKSADNKGIYLVTKKGAEVVYNAPANKKAKKVVIPATISVDGVTYKVVGIAKKAFANNKKITSVVIGKNVKVIGDEAFSKCTALKKVTIPASVNKIGKKAFYNCKSLKTITIKTTKLTAKNVGSNAWKGAGSKYYSKVKMIVPKKKLAAYKKLFRSKGLSKKVIVRK